VPKEKGCLSFDLDERIDLGELSEKIDEVFEAIPIPECCMHVTLALDEFAGATIKDVLSEVSKQPRNCMEFSRWATATAILMAYVGTELCG
jgi:hypothetical protein